MSVHHKQNKQSRPRSRRSRGFRPLLFGVFVALLLAGVAGIMAQTTSQGPWPFFHRDASRKGEAATHLPARSALFGTVNTTTPKNRWNFPHLIQNNLQGRSNLPMPWNMGNITASPTVGPGLSTGAGNPDALFVASYDRYKFELPAGATPIMNQRTTDTEQYQPYNVSSHGTVWSFNARQGPGVNALEGDWWWGYRDAQIAFRTFGELNGQPLDPADATDTDPPDTTAPNPSLGIHVRRISNRTDPYFSDSPNIAGLDNAQINAGGVPRPGTDTENFYRFMFYRLVSRSIVGSYPIPEIGPNVTSPPDRGSYRPVGNIRSTPSYYRLSTAVSYARVAATNLSQFNTLADPYDRSNSRTYTRELRTTSDVLVFGADDGYVYCLDVSPQNLITHTWQDPQGRTHTTRVPPLMWRFYTPSLVNSRLEGEQAVNTQVLSSPLITEQIPGFGGPVVVIGTGVGYMAVLNVSNGEHRNSVGTDYLLNFESGSFKFRLLAGIQTSPALYARQGQRPWVIFGADDGTIYAWDAAVTTGQSGIQWRFYTGQPPSAAAPRDRTLLFNPPVIASPVVLTSAEAGANMIIVGATAHKGATMITQNPNRGAVYALNAEFGTERWNFQEWYDLRKVDDVADTSNPDAVTPIGPVRATPAFSNNVAIANGGAQNRIVFVRDDNGDLYALRVGTNIATDPVRKDDARMAWEIPFDLGGESAYAGKAFSSSPVVTSAGLVYVGSGQGRIRAIDPSGVGTIRLGNNNFTNPDFAQGEAVWQYVTGILSVSGFNQRLGTQTYEIKSRPIIGSPALALNFLYVVTDGAVFAYQDTASAGSGGVTNPFADVAIEPTQEEQPSGGAVNEQNEATRPQAEIVSSPTYNRITEAAGDDELNWQHPIAHAFDPGNPPGGDPTVGWNARSPGRLEWGDPVHVIAWNLNENVPRAFIELQGPGGNARFEVPVVDRPDGNTGNQLGYQGFVKYTINLDPYTPMIRNPMPGGPPLIQNPLYRNPLTPGGNGTPTWTVQVSQNAPSTTPGQGASRSTSNVNNTISRFRINNPIDLIPATPAGAPGARLSEQFPLNKGMNGNRDVPFMGITEGSHGQTTNFQRFFISDRSNLRRINQRLRVKLVGADLQWLGGGKAVYKPLFRLYQETAAATSPSVPARPQLSILSPYMNADAEVPPSPPGMPNLSPNYPNIPASQFQFRGGGGENPIEQEIVLPQSPAGLNPAYMVDYAIDIPKYQPANRYPLGRGYATVNPSNVFTSAVMTNPNKFDPPRYAPTYPLDNTFLPRVYADTSRNRTIDVNEAYRTFIAWTEVNVSESLAVVEETIEAPAPDVLDPALGITPATATPPGIAHGFVPYTRYGRSTAEQPDPALLRVQAPFFRRFTIVNTGNVNLWNVRMESNNNPNPDAAPIVDSLKSETVDVNPKRVGNGPTRLTGVIPAENLQSTLDPAPGANPADPSTWIPVLKPQPSLDPKAEGSRIKVRDPFVHPDTTPPTNSADPRFQGLPRMTVAVPLGTPVGKYVTNPAFFEDGKFTGNPGNWMVAANGYFENEVDNQATNIPDPRFPNTNRVIHVGESGTRDREFAVEVMEARATGLSPLAFAERYLDANGQQQSYLPGSNEDPLNSMARTNSQVRYPVQLPYSLAPGEWPVRDSNTPVFSNHEPTAYRDATGGMHLIWASNRPVAGSGDTEWVLWTSSLQFTRPDFGPNAARPWGWFYLGGSGGGGFYDPTREARWWTNPTAVPIPAAATGYRIIGSPAVVTDNSGQYGGATWLFFVASTDVTVGTSTRHFNRIFYVRLDNQGRPTGTVHQFPWGQETFFSSLKPFYFTAQGQPRLGLVWHAGETNRWKLYASSVPVAGLNTPGQWSPSVQLATPATLNYASEPSPFRKAEANNQAYIDVAFTGFNNTAGHADIYFQRFTHNEDFTRWTAFTLPAVRDEMPTRVPGEPSYLTRGLDWNTAMTPVITWILPGGFTRVFDSPVERNGRLEYRRDGYTVFADPALGKISFASDDPVQFRVPRGNTDPTATNEDRVFVSYQPRALRLTVGPESDTQPSLFIDRSQEYIPPDQPSRTPSGTSAQGSHIPRDRMWVIWRKADVQVGGGSSGDQQGQTGGAATVKASTLFYSTYRLTAQLSNAIAVDASSKPQVSVSGAVGPWTVDVGTGRIFFTERDEAREVSISYVTTNNRSLTERRTVTWIPEVSGKQNPEIVIPIKTTLNEGQVWAFKDPFSAIPPSNAQDYMELSNNNVWLFYTSSRSGLSDVYYQTISPRLLPAPKPD